MDSKSRSKGKGKAIAYEEFDENRLALRLAPPSNDPSPSSPPPSPLPLPSPVVTLTFPTAPILTSSLFSPGEMPVLVAAPPSPEPDTQREDVAPPSPSSPPPLPPQLPPRQMRAPRNPIAGGKSERIDPPHPWSADRRATVLPLVTLLEMGVTVVHGYAQCKKCDFPMWIQYDLESHFMKVARVIVRRKDLMHNCALSEWMNPRMEACPSCKHPNCMRPVIAPKKRNINWLFMLLGQTIGTCTLDQLRYFCKHARRHRTGAKNRVLYSTYMALCKQLDPDGPFNE